MTYNLVVVESPAKARTIKKYLGPTFDVVACYGHVRDLIPKTGSVLPDEDFRMKYALIERNKLHLSTIRRKARQSKALYLAMDPDREGESIAWHLCEALAEGALLSEKPVHRVVFHEITKEAVCNAIANPRPIETKLVYAQQARRALDYLVGFQLSPLLWKKIHRGLSAGRVQSPALRMIAEREQEIDAFKPKNYWIVTAENCFKRQNFSAKLTVYEGKKIQKFTLTTTEAAVEICSAIKQESQGKLNVLHVEKKQKRRSPPPPYTTSTLQQDGGSKLRMSTSVTMKIAQQLYEGSEVHLGVTTGLITYMRTDSVTISQTAINNIRGYIKDAYGEDNLSSSPRRYKTKSKNAQEAHEAIRVTDAKRTPNSLRQYLSAEQYKLYDLIWRRTVATQMAPAIIDAVGIDLDCKGKAIFHTSGQTIRSAGFLTVYQLPASPQKEKETPEKEHSDSKLPALKVGDSVALKDVSWKEHATEPPPRFNEGSLVKSLEEHGIGRPSTYASIISTIKSRKYVEVDKRVFFMTDTGKAVNTFLTQHFTKYVDYNFTAQLEDELDAISRGEKDWKKVLEGFWSPFHELLLEKEQTLQKEDLSITRELGIDPKSGKSVSVRLGRFGPYAQIGTKTDQEKPKFSSLRKEQKMDAICLEEALELFNLPRLVGKWQDHEVWAGLGRFGPYVRYGKPQAYIALVEKDPLTISKEEAIALIQEHQREMVRNIIEKFPEEGILIINGRYGPYVKHGSKNAKIPSTCKDPSKLTLKECKDLLANAPLPRARSRKFTRKNPYSAR